MKGNNEMVWVTWHNPKSGNRTVCAHAATDIGAHRTLCGASISDLVTTALPSVPRCVKCDVRIETLAGRLP